ncbi:T9SS ring complex lipoprotein PorK/GldK [Wenyingzhuangia sp. IMCC45467]
MKKLLFLSIAYITLISCSGFGDKGELVGATSENPWFAEKPFGMVLVPGGSFTMGKTEENRWGGFEMPPRSVAVKEFFMDDTEITNSEYKEFVYWVRDSIVRSELANYAEGFSTLDDKSDFGIGDYKYLDADATADPDKYTPYQNYMLKTYGTIQQNHKGTLPLNWKLPLYWRADEYPDEGYAEVMDQLYLPQEDVGGMKVFDITLLKYSYIANTKQNKTNIAKKNNYAEVDINVYPDTTVWAKDFEYSHNDVMVDNYFWHAAFEAYPVVGVSWNQAKAFCNWRTKKKDDFLRAIGSGVQVPDFRLPTEAEWEFAARGGIENGKFPWGGPYVTDRNGYYLANFKPKRNNFAADGFTYTVEAKSFKANDYGLYNMAGNVSEWTSTAYNTTAAYITSSLNTDVDDPSNKRKVIKGGSWKDIAYFLEVGTRDYEYADSTKSYIGFRTVQDYLGDAKWGGLNY